MHDSRAAERGYSGYARSTSDAGESGGFGLYDLPPSYDDADWYGSAGEPGPAGTSHPSGPLPGTHGGYGAAGQDGPYGAPVYTEADYGDAGSGNGQYEAGDGAYDAAGNGRYEAGDGAYDAAGESGYGAAGDGGYEAGDGSYEEGRYRESPYGGPGSGPGQYAGGQYAAGEQQHADGGYEPGEAGGSLPGGQHAGYQNLPPGQDGSYQQDAYAGHQAGGYGQPGYTNPPGYQDAGYASYPDDGQRKAGYPDASHHGTGYQDEGYQGAGYQEPGTGYQEPGTGHQEPGTGGHGHQPAALSEQYGYADYGDPRYDDPSYGDLAYDDTPHAGAAYGGTAQAEPSYQNEGYQHAGYQDTGYGDHGHGGYQDAESQAGPASPAAEYGTGGYQAGYDGAAGYAEDPGQEPAAGSGGDPAYAADGYGPGPGFQDPDRGGDGPDGMPGYVASEYVSGQYPAGTGAMGELSGGLPDPAATGMLEATGILDSTGISDHVELYNYHPGAAEANQGFLDAPAPVGTLRLTGVDPSGFLDGPAQEDHGIVLGGAEAGDATGVLEGGSGFFDHADPAETSIDLPAASPGRGGQTGGTGAQVRPWPGSRPAGRRRGRSGDRRLWFALAGVVVVMAGALAAIFMLAFPSGPGGPAHTLVTPNQLNAFIRRPALEQQMNVGQLRQDVVNMSSGQARHVVEAVYEAGNSTSGSTPQIVLFIGGNLLNASPKVSVTSFTQRFKGVGVTSAGALGGEAACVNATASEPGSVAMCAWFDNDSFGEVVSPTMNASALANIMRQIRPHVELVVRQKQ